MKKYTGTTCKVAGCDQPRRVLGNGKLSTLCDAHQREAWRNGAAATRKQPGRAAAAPPPAARPQAAAPPGRASTDECAGCIYREVIEKLAKRDTRIGELVKALERVHELERELFAGEEPPEDAPPAPDDPPDEPDEPEGGTLVDPPDEAGDGTEPGDLLSASEEVALARRVQAGDRAAREELVMRNQGLVHYVARRFFSHDPALSWDDLTQEGQIGLLKAVDSYNPDVGTRFSTHAVWWIRQAIGRRVLESGRIRVGGHRKLSAKSLAAAQAARVVLDLDGPISPQDSRELGWVLAAGTDVEEQALNNVLLEQALASISPQARKALRLRLAGLTNAEIGRQMGVSRGYAWFAIEVARRALGVQARE